jgi:hypothetical protein
MLYPLYAFPGTDRLGHSKTTIFEPSNHDLISSDGKIISQ